MTVARSSSPRMEVSIAVDTLDVMPTAPTVTRLAFRGPICLCPHMSTCSNAFDNHGLLLLVIDDVG